MSTGSQLGISLKWNEGYEAKGAALDADTATLPMRTSKGLILSPYIYNIRGFRFSLSKWARFCI